MGYLHGRLRNFRRSFPELRHRAGRQSSHSCRRLRARMPTSAGATLVRHHIASGENSARTAQPAQDPERGVTDGFRVALTEPRLAIQMPLNPADTSW